MSAFWHEPGGLYFCSCFHHNHQGGILGFDVERGGPEEAEDSLAMPGFGKLEFTVPMAMTKSESYGSPMWNKPSHPASGRVFAIQVSVHHLITFMASQPSVKIKGVCVGKW